ncbi:MAG: preprotein translocase subunit SecY [Eubacteriales bacterium]
MFKTLRNAFKIPDLRSKILYTLLMLVVIRLGAQIFVPGVDSSIIKNMFQQESDIFSLFNAMTGGSFQDMTIFAMGIIPYITASIIMNLLTIAIPKLEEMQKEGEEGRKKIAKYTRYFTIGLATIQALATAIGFGRQGMILNYGFWSVAMFTLSLVAGTAFLMWIGERITERGVGNGISLIITINILSTLPIDLRKIYEQIMSDKSFIEILILALIVLIILVVMVAFIVVLQLGERRIPVQYAKKMQGRKMVGGQSTHIPLKVNTAGVIPVIFAGSLLQFPTVIAQLTGNLPEDGFWYNFFNFMNYRNLSGAIIYGLLIIFFAYFYTSITFNPIEVANNMKKNGGFVPGIRPGKPTVEYLSKVVSHIVLVGALGLAFISLLPIGLERAFHLQQLSFGGTSLIIVVGVALETVKQIEAQMLMRHYKGFLNS